MVFMVADAARLDAVRQDLRELGAPGYSALPVIEGAGRTGVHAGDRTHPGGLVALIVVEPGAQAEKLFEELAGRRDAAGDTVTRLFLLPVEREA